MWQDAIIDGFDRMSHFKQSNLKRSVPRFQVSAHFLYERQRGTVVMFSSGKYLGKAGHYKGISIGAHLCWLIM